MSENNYCFCTLAIGLEYRLAALFLYMDIKAQNPGQSLIVLTDDTDYFKGYSNIIAIKFSTDSMIGCYHDKRFVISQALLRYESCYYLDADCRLIGEVPDLSAAGNKTIYAWNVLDFLPRFEMERNWEIKRGSAGFNSCERRLGLMTAVAGSLDVDLRDTKFMSEVCMFFSRSDGESKVFFELWNKIARRLQRQGYSWGEGETIGIVAQKLNWDVKPIDCSTWLFKDALTKIESEKILQCRRDRVAIASLKSKRRPAERFLRLIVEAPRHLTNSNKKYLVTRMGTA